MGREAMNPDQRIYRFVAFFDLYNLIRKQEYRLTPLVRFQKSKDGDKNEGIGLYLQSKMRQYTPMMERDDAFLKIEYEIELCSTYISSWTKNPDNIAMWYLYSPHRDTVRIATSLSKLNKMLSDTKKLKVDVRHLSSKFKIYKTDIVEVTYVDIHGITNDVESINSQVREEFNKVEEQLRGKPLREQISAYRNTVRGRFDRIALLGNPLEYKNRAYYYEDEVRVIVNLEAGDEDTSDQIHASFHLYRDFVDDRVHIFPDDIYLKVENDFIEEVCFDPRCELYKVGIFKEIIDRNDLYVESNVFGAVL